MLRLLVYRRAELIRPRHRTFVELPALLVPGPRRREHHAGSCRPGCTAAAPSAGRSRSCCSRPAPTETGRPSPSTVVPAAGGATAAHGLDHPALAAQRLDGGRWRARPSLAGAACRSLQQSGELPLPPYIHQPYGRSRALPEVYADFQRNLPPRRTAPACVSRRRAVLSPCEARCQVVGGGAAHRPQKTSAPSPAELLTSTRSRARPTPRRLPPRAPRDERSGGLPARRVVLRHHHRPARGRDAGRPLAAPDRGSHPPVCHAGYPLPRRSRALVTSPSCLLDPAGPRHGVCGVAETRRASPGDRAPATALLVRRCEPAAYHRRLTVRPSGRRRRPARDGPRRARDAGFMPVGTKGTVKALDPRSSPTWARDRARQHLPPALPPRRGPDRRARRAAPLHGLGAADPHRLGWLPGVLAARHRSCSSTRTA